MKEKKKELLRKRQELDIERKKKNLLPSNILSALGKIQKKDEKKPNPNQQKPLQKSQKRAEPQYEDGDEEDEDDDDDEDDVEDDDKPKNKRQTFSDEDDIFGDPFDLLSSDEGDDSDEEEDEDDDEDDHNDHHERYAGDEEIAIYEELQQAGPQEKTSKPLLKVKNKAGINVAFLKTSTKNTALLPTPQLNPSGVVESQKSSNFLRAIQKGSSVPRSKFRATQQGSSRRAKTNTTRSAAKLGVFSKTSFVTFRN